MHTLSNILLGTLTFIAGIFGGVGHLYGTTLTTLNGSDHQNNFPTTYNANNTALNNGKIDVGSTSINAITTLSNLSSVGTISSGGWQGSAVGAAYGGTGSTTLSSNQILLGNGTGALKPVSGYGTSGQSLISNGTGVAPSWQSGSFDQTLSYTLTGTWNWSTGVVGIGTSSPYNPFAYVSNKPAVFSTIYATSTATGNATSTFDGNVRIGNNASTTNLTISGTCTKGGGVGCNQITKITGSTGALSTGNSAQTTYTATCTGSQLVVGGGGFTDTPASPIWLTQSYPSATNAWTVTYTASASGGGVGGTANAYALCINP